jgi:SAM-dependent methyltransferase
MHSSQSSLPPDYFDSLYSADSDPWKFETSAYEAKKYDATLAALPKTRYRSALEIGGSIGVLTEMLAERCDSLLAVDVSERAQQKAIDRCQSLPQVRFQLMQIPQTYPEEQFDLTVLSEVGYYWCWEDLKQAQQLMLEHLEPGGHLLLVHWTPYADYYDNPLSGDDVHESFLALPSSQIKHLGGDRADKYRLDVFERVENTLI